MENGSPVHSKEEAYHSWKGILLFNPLISWVLELGSMYAQEYSATEEGVTKATEWKGKNLWECQFNQMW